ncbi:MAG: HdeA/HdeB family chaperone [Tardiphaga sp.]
MKKALSVLLFTAVMLPSAARAQLIIDMNRLTCAQFLAMSPQQARIYSAWISGWFNQKTGYVWVDLNAYERNFTNVRQWCATSPGQTVMEGLKRSTGTL